MDKANSGPDILDEMIKFSREVASAIAMMSLNHRYGVVKMSPFCPIFLGHPRARASASKAERLLYRREPMFGWVAEIVGWNRESRLSEAAGRGNSPEAKPRTRDGRKRVAYWTQ